MSTDNQHPSMNDLLRMIQSNTDPKKRVVYLQQLVDALQSDPLLRYSTRQQLLSVFQSSVPYIIPSNLYKELPFPIAYSIEQANKHSYDPLIQLLFLFDALEVTLRWCCGYGFTVLEAQYSNGVPDNIMYQIHDNLTTPSFGQWLHIARVVFSSIRSILPKDIKQFDAWYSGIIQKRNALAHGGYGADVQPILKDTVQETIALLKWLRSLHEQYQVVVVSHGQKYDGTGITLAPYTKKIPNISEDGVYVLKTGENSAHKIPYLFVPSKEESNPPLILSMMGSDGIKKFGKSSVLKYIQINGSELEKLTDESTISSFIQYFKTNHKTLATQPWEVELKKWSSSLDHAWYYDIELIKNWRKTRYKKEDQTETGAHILWFGGGNEHGRTTILNSSAYKLNNNQKNTYSFVYSFQNASIDSVEDAQKALNHFLLQLRQAINFWTQKDASTPELDHTIRDGVLVTDIVNRIASFLSIKQEMNTREENYPCIVLAIDDVHCLKSVEVYKQLLKYLKELKTSNNQVLCILTGISTIAQQDIDTVFTNQDPTIDWLYDIVRIQNCPLCSIDTGVAHNRYTEICAHYNTQQQDKGAHLPPLQESGIMGIITHANEALNSELSVTHPFIQRVKQLAQSRPRYVDVVATQLQNKQITIHDTLQDKMVLQGYFSQRFQSQAIGDVQRILAFVLCALEQHEPTPLTTEALQMLHDHTTIPNQNSVETIQSILLQSQGLLEAVHMNSVNKDGSVQYGWRLGSPEIAKAIRNTSANSVLFHTHKEAKQNKQWLQQHHADILEGTQLKELYAPNSSIISDFTKIFRDIRGKMVADIMDLPESSSHGHVYKNVRNRLVKTSTSGQVHTSWLQIGTEYEKTNALYTEAQDFLKNSAFADLWLHRVNAPHLPFSEHQRGAFTSTEKAQKMFALGNDHFIICGEAAYVLSSVSQAKEECILYTKPIDDRGSIVGEYFVEEDGVGYLVVALPNSVITLQITVANGVVVTPHTQEVGNEGNKEEILGLLQRPKTCIIHGVLSEAMEWDPIAQSVVRRWKYPGTPQNNAYFILSDHWGYREVRNAKLHVFSLSTSMSKSFPLTTRSSSPLPILDAHQQLVKYGAVAGTNDKNDCVIWDIAQGECILTQGISKVVALFEVFEGILTVHIDGTITHHPYGNSATKSISLQDLLSKHTDYREKTTEDRFKWRLKGALFYENKLVVYGDSQLLVGVEILSGNLDKAKILPFPQLHYGTGQSAITDMQIVSNAQVSADFLSKHNISIHKTGYTSLAISQSFDNDIRLWNLDTQECIGLCRGLGDKLSNMLISHNHVIGVDQSRNLIIWEFNDGMSTQLRSSPQRQGGYISFAYRYGDELVVMDNYNQIGKFANQGADWSINSFHMYAATPTTPHATMKECIPCQNHIVGVVGSSSSSSLYTVKVSSCEWEKISLKIKPNGETEIELRVDKLFALQRSSLVKPTEFLARAYAGSNYYLLLIREDGTISKWVSTPKFTSVYTTGLDNIWICATTETTDKEIYLVNWNGTHTQVCTFHSSQQIEGFYVFDTKILAWAKPIPGTATPLFYAEKMNNQWQFFKMKGNFVIQHNSCTNMPQQVLLAKDGLYFSVVDEDKMWWIYPNEQVLQEVNITTEPMEDFIANHQHTFFGSVAPIRTISNGDVSAMAFPVSYGINLYLKHSSWEDMQQLVWLGMLSKTHRVLELLPNGRIIAVRNRDVIVLQLMKGSKVVDFSNFHL